VIDLHAKRLTAAMRNRIPGAIWVALFFVTSIAMGAVGYQMGLNRGRRTIVALAIVLTFAVIMFVIADLDHPQQGFLQISQRPMIELQKDINKPAP
jgi:membrane protein YdbS with pleckstrin-like domain